MPDSRRTDTPSDPAQVDSRAVTSSPAPQGRASKAPEPGNPDDLGSADRVQWFGRPDKDARPIGFWRIVLITLSGHIGVRSRANRHDDFRRANGLHVFIAAIVYFSLIIGALIALTHFIAGLQPVTPPHPAPHSAIMPAR